MNAKTVLAILLLSAIGSRTVYAQSLQDYLRLAAENNPGLRAAFDEYRASLEKIPQVRSLPDPQLSFGFFITPMEGYTGDKVAEISVMQMLPWFGTLGAAKTEAEQMAKARFETFNDAKSALFYEVKERWFALHLLDKQTALVEENIRILQSLETIALSRYSNTGSRGNTNSAAGMPDNRREPNANTGSSTAQSGAMSGMQGSSPTGAASTSETMGAGAAMGGMSDGGSMGDVLSIQIEINSLQTRLALLRDDRTVLAARFNQSLNRPSRDSIHVSDSIAELPLPVDSTQIPDSIRANNPMLIMLDREDSALSAMERMKRKMGFPMIGIGLQYEIIRPRSDVESMMNGENMLMPMATVTVPLWRRKYRASVREAGLLRDAVIGKRENMTNQLQVDYETVLRDYRDAQRRVELYQRQRVLAQQAYNILIVGYSTEGSGFEQVMRMQQQVIDFGLKGVEAAVDRNVAVAALERLMGR